MIFDYVEELARHGAPACPLDIEPKTESPSLYAPTQPYSMAYNYELFKENLAPIDL